MTIIQRIKLAWLVFSTSGNLPGSIMPDVQLASWKNTLLKTECREEILVQFANSAAAHSIEYVRMRRVNAEIALELQESQEECRQLEDWTSKEFEALCKLDPKYRRSTVTNPGHWDDDAGVWRERKES